MMNMDNEYTAEASHADKRRLYEHPWLAGAGEYE